MQVNPVYLYRNKITVFTSAEPWTIERYRQVYQRNFKIYRGVNNKLDVQIRNSDQKPYNISDHTLVFNLIERETQRLLVSKDFTITSAAQGQITVTVTEAELNNIAHGLYNYSIIKEVRENGVTISSAPLYVDSQYGSLGVIEVFSDLYGETKESQVIDNFAIIPETWPNDDTSKSELAYASPEFASTQTIHTFAIYQNNYEGVVTIEGSLETGGTPRAGKWATLAEIEYPSTTKYINVEGKWNWFRIKHLPDRYNEGTVDKVLYR